MSRSVMLGLLKMGTNGNEILEILQSIVDGNVES